MADEKVKNKAIVPLKDDKGNVTIHNTESDKSVMPRNSATDHLNPAKEAGTLADDKTLPFNVYKDKDGNLSIVNPESEKGGFNDPAKDKLHREKQAEELAQKKDAEKKA